MQMLKHVKVNLPPLTYRKTAINWFSSKNYYGKYLKALTYIWLIFNTTGKNIFEKI